MMSPHTAGLLVLGCGASLSGGVLAAPPAVALVQGEVHPISGPIIRRGTVLIRGERIAAVGHDVPIPSGTEVVNVRGRIVTPGFVAADTQLGLMEVGLEAMSNDSQPRLKHPIRASLRADDAYDVASSLIAVARRHGVTSAVSGPGGGLVSGRAGWFDLLDAQDPSGHDAFRRLVGMRVRLGELGAGAVGGSRTAAVARLRAYLGDVRIFQGSQKRYRANDLYRMSASRSDLEAGVAVLDGKLPLVIEVHRASDIRATLGLLNSFPTKAVLLGVSEGWLVADTLARRGIPVIVDPIENLPVRFEARAARSDNAAIMARAGVKVILTRRDSHNAGNLRFAVGNAVRAGFPAALALRSVTLSPAEVFSVDQELGSLRPGRLANVVVWSGDPFEPASHAEQVIIRGRRQPLESRQTMLARRYLKRLGLASGQSKPEKTSK